MAIDPPIVEWIPGHGISTDAIARMRENLKQPDLLMGEAWFMSEERRMYPELADRETFLDLETNDLTSVLFEISSGTSSFGPYEEWTEWFKFLLPDLVFKSLDRQWFKTYVLQPVLTDFMAVFWIGIPTPYDGFRDDVIRTLFRALMDKTMWTNDLKGPEFLTEFENGRGEIVLDWGQGRSDGNVAAMLMFGIKYLEPEEIPTWTRSVVTIDNIYWRGNLLNWLLGAYDVLKKGYVDPSTFDEDHPELSWDSAHVLNLDRFTGYHNSPFLTEKNISVFLSEIESLITYDLLIQSAESFQRNDFVASSTYRIPEKLAEKMGL